MRNQRHDWIDIFGLILSGLIAIVALIALHEQPPIPLINYRESDEFDLIPFLILGFIILLMIVQAIALIHRFYAERLRRKPGWVNVRLLIPTLILCIFLLNYNFPGVSAPIEVRQQWAMKEFRDFNGVVKTIERCRGIVDRVGQVKFVAPTHGRNYVLVDGGSGYHGEMTLEVVGDKASGVANLRIYLGSIRSGEIQFTDASETKNIRCYKS